MRKNILSRLIKSVLPLVTAMMFIAVSPGYCNVYADDNEDKTVRIGWYESTLFQEGMSDSEKKSGYCYDYIQKVEDYTGWETEYEYGSWTELLAMLQNGEIDLMGGVSASLERKKTLLFPDFAMGNERYCIYKHSGDGSTNSGDISSLDNAKVGVVSDSMMEYCTAKWAKENNISFSFSFYDSIESVNAAFDNREIDVMVRTDTNVIQKKNVEYVATVGEEPYYFAVSGKRPDLLEELNASLSAIISVDPFVFQNLQYQNYRLRIVSGILSEHETNWLDSHDTITVGYLNNYLPYCDEDGGRATGLITDVMPGILDALNISDRVKAVYRPYDNYEEMVEALKAKEIDAAFPVYGDRWELEKSGINATTAVVVCGEAFFYTGSYDKDKINKIAVNKNNSIQILYCTKNFPDAELYYCDSIEQCLESVSLGVADGTIVNSLRTELVTGSNKYKNLSYVQLGVRDKRCLGINEDEKDLLLLLNRGLNLIGDSYGIDNSYKYMDRFFQYTSIDFIKDNIITLSICVFFAIGLIIYLLVSLVIRKEKSVKEKEDLNKQLQNSTALLENQINIIGGLANAFIACYEVDINKQTFAPIKEVKHISELLLGINDINQAFDRYAKERVNKESIEEFRIFTDYQTLTERMKFTDTISFEYLGGKDAHRWYQASWIVTKRSEYGKPEVFMFVVREITGSVLERKKREQEKLNEQLTNELRMRTMAEAIHGGFKISRPDFTLSFKLVSRQLSRLLGYNSPEEMLELNGESMFNRIHPDDMDDVKSRLYEAFTKDEMATMKYRMKCKDGTWKNVEDKSRLIENIDGEKEIWSFIVDVDELVSVTEALEIANHANDTLEKTQRDLVVANEEAMRASKAKSDFLFSMSHDIRTPMNAIIGYTELLDKYRDNPQKHKYYLDRIKSANYFLLSLINNVLEMARIESGKTTLEEQTVNIDEVFKEIISVYHQLMAEKNIEFTYLEEFKTKAVYCDPLKFKQIMMNILSNACKYTMPGGKVTVHTSELPCERAGYTVLKTTISDTGIGISKEFLPKIFDEFSRERSSTDSKIEGTGLGMSIVKRFVDIMDGDISVESELGIGTTFTVIIPLKIAELNETAELRADEVDTGILIGKKILMAEDNEMNTEIAGEILSSMGIIYDTVTDGQECLDRIIEKPAGYYDLILMDIQMPKMNGYEATKAIRMLDDKSKASIPIVAMTANAFKVDRQNAERAGMNGHISKPIDIKKMKETLIDVLK
ncbi:MAG: transporter substrate-binding domain-containing protein [Oscillospiraceae bacterium]|nr:transporter substrate-binding domain-containing protein [Oscillospiraceae bacterium]